MTTEPTPKPSHHKPNWLGKPSAEMRADAQAGRDAAPVVKRCLFCRWRFKGTAGEGRVAARAHRETAHPEAVGKRTVRRQKTYWIRPVDDGLINEQRRARELREEAERLATIERGRQRREAAA